MNTNTTLGELAAQYPSATKVFQAHGLDYCCGGHQSLADACQAKNLSPEQLRNEIEQENDGSPHYTTWDTRPFGDLIEYILTRYHQPLREELPRLIDLAAKVERVHGEKTECPTGLHSHLIEVREAVESHLAKEEQILFPMIRLGHLRVATHPIRVMMAEHEDHGANLRKTRALTGDFTLPASACASWHELYRSLEQLERDLMDHIHLENNILFPRVVNCLGENPPASDVIQRSNS